MSVVRQKDCNQQIQQNAKAQEEVVFCSAQCKPLVQGCPQEEIHTVLHLYMVDLNRPLAQFFGGVQSWFLVSNLRFSGFLLSCPKARAGSK